MKWISKIHTTSSLSHVVDEIRAGVEKEFGKEKLDIAFIFFSKHFRSQLVDSWSALEKEIPAKLVLGATAAGIIGSASEIENEPAASFLGGQLPNVRIEPFHFHDSDLPSLDGSPRVWRDRFKITPKDKPSFITIIDPFSFNPQKLIDGFNYAFPGAPIVGGLASGGSKANENLLLFGEKAFHQGAIGVTLNGQVTLEPVLAQGCRPIGSPFKITQAQDNILLSVDNQPPLDQLGKIYAEASEKDRTLMSTSLFFGILNDSLIEAPKAADFLIRNIVWVDQKQGIIGIGETLRIGQTAQFFIRDAESSAIDLKHALERSKAFRSPAPDTPGVANRGVLVFSCLGRGTNLYQEPHHDARVIAAATKQAPLAGFFCSGEIGPVQGLAHLHGYTSSMAVFTEPQTTNKKNILSTKIPERK